MVPLKVLEGRFIKRAKTSVSILLSFLPAPTSFVACIFAARRVSIFTTRDGGLFQCNNNAHNNTHTYTCNVHTIFFEMCDHYAVFFSRETEQMRKTREDSFSTCFSFLTIFYKNKESNGLY